MFLIIICADIRVILKICDEADSTQLFSYNPTSDRIYVEDSHSYCAGYDVDNEVNGNPLTIFKCDNVC
jgi:hypothetical protein